MKTYTFRIEEETFAGFKSREIRISADTEEEAKAKGWKLCTKALSMDLLEVESTGIDAYNRIFGGK